MVAYKPILYKSIIGSHSVYGCPYIHTALMDWYINVEEECNWLLTLIQSQGMGMVLLRKCDHSLLAEGVNSCLVHSLPGDGGGSRAGPIQSVPGSMVGEALHWTYIWKNKHIKAMLKCLPCNLIRMLQRGMDQTKCRPFLKDPHV